MTIGSDELHNQAFIADVAAKSAAALLQKLKGAHITKINGEDAFSQEQAIQILRQLHDEKASTIHFELAPECELVSQACDRVLKEHDVHHPDALSLDEEHNHATSLVDLHTCHPGALWK